MFSLVIRAGLFMIFLNGHFQVHSHETVWSVKQKIASLLRTSADQLMLVIGDRPSPPGNLNSISSATYTINLNLNFHI